MAELSGNVLVPGGRIGSGEAQVFNPMPTLGVLGNLANRRDAMAKFEALQRMKANKPVKEEPIKYPEFDVAAKGGLFPMKYAEDNLKDDMEAIDAIRRANGDPYITAQVTRAAKAKKMGRGVMLDQQQERFYKRAEELNKTGYAFNPDKVAHELTQKGDNYLDPSLNIKMEEKVKRNPAYFNYAQLGDKAAKDAGVKKAKVIDIDGNETETNIPVFATYNRKTGKMQVKTGDGLKYLKQDPVIKEQLPFVYEELFNQFGYDKNILSKAYEDLTDAEKGILLKVTDKAVDRYIGGRLGFEVVNDYEKKDKGGDEKDKKYATSTGTRSNFVFSVPLKDAKGKVVKDLKMNGTFTDPKAENHIFDRPQVANAGTRAFLLSDPGVAEAAGLVQANNRGGYTINQGFQYRLASKQRRPFTKEPIDFTRNGKVIYTVPANTPLDDVVYQNIKNDKAKLAKTQFLSGYEVTADVVYPNTDEYGNPIDSDGKQLKGGRYPSIKLFIPEEDGVDIQTAIDRDSDAGSGPQKTQGILDIWKKK